MNSSVANFASIGGDIRFGLSAVRNVGINVVESIIRARTESGAYTSFTDFLDKVDQVVCNKRVLESLAKAGAFDSLGHSRRGLVAVHADAVDAVVEVKKASAAGQFDLFGGLSEDVDSGTAIVVPDGEWDKRTLLAYEREMLGLYVSDHPLNGVEHVLAAKADAPISALHADDRADGAVLTVGGLVTGVQRKINKAGASWAIITLEDMAGSIDVMIFAQTYQLVGMHCVEDAVLLVKGRLDKQDEDAVKFVALEVKVPIWRWTAARRWRCGWRRVAACRRRSPASKRSSRPTPEPLRCNCSW